MRYPQRKRFRVNNFLRKSLFKKEKRFKILIYPIFIEQIEIMKRKITLKQIARELDVSISTVSKALRNSKEISEDTREKVQAFAKLYNYRPNNIALSLKNRKTKTIGIIIPEIVHHFFSKVISGIELVANKQGYNVIVGLSNESFDKEVINMEMLANGSIDGFILSISKETLLQQDYHHFNETISQGMPIVMFDRIVNDIKCDKVIVDDVKGAKKAVTKLVSNGCKNIAIITTKDYVSVGRLRTQGYLEALEEHKIHPKASLILKVDDKLVSEDYLDVLEDETADVDTSPHLLGCFCGITLGINHLVTTKHIQDLHPVVTPDLDSFRSGTEEPFIPALRNQSPLVNRGQ